MAAALRIEQPKQVLVEGNDEVRLFGVLAQHLGISDFQINQYRGRDNLRPFLKALPLLAGFENINSLAVVADANSNRNATEQRIRAALSAAGLPSPRRPLEVLAQDNMRVCYLVVPHDAASGMIEDVCLASVGADPAIECVERYFECIRQTDLPGPKKVRMAKARLHAFLASREEPHLRLGEATDAGIWDFGADAFRPLKDLLELL
ncbi:MAG: hypothetical protein OXQ29_09755 [Rhodospirillaceae bacterium]|nr:hypothetical protein [Rhodospirillaceae bacterium]